MGQYRYGLTCRQYIHRAFVGLVVINAVLIVAAFILSATLDGLASWASVAVSLFAVYIAHRAMMAAYRDWQSHR